MKSLLRILEEMLALWLVCFFAGSSCAVFYTQSNNNDFPRLGRRSVFTASSSGVYPRIGRSGSTLSSRDNDDEVVDDVLADDSPLFDSSSSSSSSSSFPAASAALHKRGIFTAGGPGFPRIGRRALQRKQSRAGELSPRVVTSVESPDVERAVGGARRRAVEEEVEEAGRRRRFEYPLGLMFFEFDKDGDKQLSREEFVQGMERARRDGTLFR